MNMQNKTLTKSSNLLDVKVENYGECGWCSSPSNTIVLNIPWTIWTQWLHISRQMGNKEWGAVFWVKDNSIIDFKIPLQEVSSADCEFKEELGGDGMIHSHHNMGAFHSSQDDHHARNLYDYSIVLSNTNGYEATMRKKLPCGGFGYGKVQLRLTECPDVDFSKILEKKQELFTTAPSENETQEQLEFEEDLPCERCTTFDCNSCRYVDGVQLG